MGMNVEEKSIAPFSPYIGLDASRAEVINPKKPKRKPCAEASIYPIRADIKGTTPLMFTV